LETLNEELQATVEELNTTNDDLQARSVELQDLAVSLEDQRRASDTERARLQVMLTALPDAVALLDNQGAAALSNPAYDRLFGASKDSLVFEDESGRLLMQHQLPGPRAARGESFTMRFVARSLDGQRQLLEARASTVRAEDAERNAGLLVIRKVGADST
jgi:two-component system CheB/CheR fusion protein